MKKTFSGTVVEGSKRATKLGFPTANIHVGEKISGIYAGTVEVGGKEYRAALFGDEKREILEAYILDFDANLYGEAATFTLLQKVREHGVFKDDESLKKQIAEDVARVRAFFTYFSNS